jgi:acyl-CoA synthetase (AMP-forming)/AMP-acid ligase II
MNNHFESIADILTHRAESEPDHLAYRFLDFEGGDNVKETSINYRELYESITHIAGHIQPGENETPKALLLYPPGLQYIYAFYACLYAGVIAVPAYPPFSEGTAKQIANITSKIAPDYVLTVDSYLMPLQNTLNKYMNHKRTRWLGTDRLEGHICTSVNHEIDGDRIAFLQFTSGSTAMPRGVILKHSNLLHNLSLIKKCFGHTESSVGVIWLPPYHDMGLIGGVIQPLYAGFPVILMSPLSFLKKPFRWLRAISEYRATTSGGPNFSYELCVDKISPEQREQLDLSSWRVAFNGAEQIHPETIRRFTDKFKQAGFKAKSFYPCYGLAESTLMVSGGDLGSLPNLKRFKREDSEKITSFTLGEEDDSVEYVSCGKKLDDGEIYIINPTTFEQCNAGVLGEVWVRGPSVASGYWNEGNVLNTFVTTTFHDGLRQPYLRTGDLGFICDNELYITGRIKEVIIINGKNHFPQDIEKTAGGCHPLLRKGMGAAFTIDDGGKTRILLAQETMQALDSQTYSEIGRMMRIAVAETHGLHLHKILFLKKHSLPKTTSGKVKRVTCTADYTNGKLSIVYEDSSDGFAAGHNLPPRPTV